MKRGAAVYAGEGRIEREREREREREGELRPKRTFGRGCGMKESWRRRENDREGSLEHRVYRVVEKSGGKHESRKLK